MNDRPEHIGRDTLLVLADRISDASEPRPRDVTMAGLHLAGELAARFGNCLDAPLDNALPAPIGFGDVEHHAGQVVAVNGDRLRNVGRPTIAGVIRDQTICRADVSTRLWMRGCRLRGVLRSALWPRMRAVCSSTSVR